MDDKCMQSILIAEFLGYTIDEVINKDFLDTSEGPAIIIKFSIPEIMDLTEVDLVDIGIKKIAPAVTIESISTKESMIDTFKHIIFNSFGEEWDGAISYEDASNEIKYLCRVREDEIWSRKSAEAIYNKYMTITNNTYNEV